MKIFAIDSTSAVARIALVDRNKVIKEHSSPNTHWNEMVAGNIDGLMKDFLQIIHGFFDDIAFSWDDVHHICYSGYSGFKVSMDLGKILAFFLGNVYKKQVYVCDHITSHYFSLFIDKEEDQIFPKLIYSASGSHNSIVYMKDWNTVIILNDSTYFEDAEGKYIGLGSLYNRLLRSLDILHQNQSPQEIPGVLDALENKIDVKLVEFFLQGYKTKNIFDLDLYEYVQTGQKKILSMKKDYDASSLFFSFQQSIFQILHEKFVVITSIMPVAEIAVVGGISQNNDFIRYLEEKNTISGIKISRPLEPYRFDNASMLGVLSFYTQKLGIEYPISKIVT